MQRTKMAPISSIALQQLKSKSASGSSAAPDAQSAAEVLHFLRRLLRCSSAIHSQNQIKRLTGQVAQLQKIIQQDDMKLMMMDFANTTQAELEAERGELQVAAAAERDCVVF